jgi:hypothetical protein
MFSSQSGKLQDLGGNNGRGTQNLLGGVPYDTPRIFWDMDVRDRENLRAEWTWTADPV